PMMVTRGDRTATGVLLKGVDPEGMKKVLDLPKHMIEGSFKGLRLPGAKPPASRREQITHSTFPDDKVDESDQEQLDPDADLFDQIEHLLEDASDAKETGQSDSPPAGGKAPTLVEGAAVGSIVPEGGYQSELPGDDVLPGELSVDPGAKNETVLPGIIIGKTLGENLRAKVGDCVQVTSPTIGYTFSNDSIRAPVAKQFRVI